MVWMLVSTVITTTVNAAVRHVSVEVHPFEVVFIRSLVGLVLLMPLLMRHGLPVLRISRPGLYGVRTVLAVSNMMFLYLAVSIAPLAKVTVLNFTAPLFATVLAVLLLGERIRARRITALIVGFAGALVVLRPGVVEIDLGTLAAMGGAVTGAMVVIIVKILTRTERTLTMLLYAMILGTPLSFLGALPVWTWPSSVEMWTWLIAIGVIDVIGQWFFTQAYKETDIGQLTPIGFVRLIWAALIGYLAFAEIPEIWTWIGGAIIFASVTAITYREQQVAAAEGKTPPRPLPE